MCFDCSAIAEGKRAPRRECIVVVEKGKRLVRFLLIVVLLQGIFLLFGTESGLSLLFTGLVRVKAEAYSPRQSANVVYYDMRLPVSEADVIVVALDFSIAESADAFLHFFRFVKQYNNVQTVLFANDAYLQYAESVNASVTGAQDDAGYPPLLAAYTEGLSAIYATMQPVRRFTTGVIPGAEFAAYTAEDKEEPMLLLCSRDAVMVPEVRARLAENNVFLWEIKYDNCVSEDGVRSDIRLPFVGEDTGYYMMAMDRIPAFCAYYRRALNLFGTPALEARAARLDNENAAYFCVITNGSGRTAQSETTPSENIISEEESGER